MLSRRAMNSSRTQLFARALGLGLTLTTAACASLRAPLTPPERGGAPWRELRSTHFVLETDEDAATAREELAEMERSHGALAYVLRRPRPEVETPVEVVLFARRIDFAASTDQRNTDGYFQTALALDTEPRPVIVVVSSELPGERRRLLQHELTHRMLHERFAIVPRWFDEGSAELYSSLRVADGKIHLGAPAKFDFSERPNFWLARMEDDAEQEEVPLRLAPRLDQLLGASAADMTGYSSDRMEAFYAASWKLVHLLTSGASAPTRAAFEAWKTDLDRGRDPKEAFSERFGDRGATLNEAYGAYLRKEVLVRNVLAAPPETPPDVQERVLGAAEVHLLWARLLESSKGAKERARKELAAAVALAPSSLEVLLCKARASVLDEELDAAKRTLDVVLAAHPDDPRALNARLDWHRRLLTRAGAANAPAAPEEIVERLARTATSAAQLDNAARYRLLFDRLDDALALAQRSVRRDPHCAACAAFHAFALWRSGRQKEAESALDRALVLAGEHASSEQLLEHRDWIRDAPPARAPEAQKR